MEFTAGKYKVSDKYVTYCSWLVILLVIVVSYLRFPLSSPIVGDESYYADEVVYLSKYGLYHALSQGTSLVLSILIFISSKLFFVDFLSGARILSVIFFVIGCMLFLKCTTRFKGVTHADRYLSLVCFGIMCSGWIWKCLADVISVSFLFAVFYLISGIAGRKQLIAAGFLLLVSFAVKPVVILTVPGLVLYVFLRGAKGNVVPAGKRFANALIFSMAFAACFILYHLPGYLTFHKLMLEVKDHHYEGVVRVDNHNSWVEKNIYYEVYNVHHKPNKWGVTWEEVDSFKVAHPEIKLNLSYSEFFKTAFRHLVSQSCQ